MIFGIKSAQILKKEFESESVYNKKVLKTKIKSYGDDTTSCHDKEISKAVSDSTCLAVITIDPALKKDENYYLQAFLKECRYFQKKWLDILLKIRIFFSNFDKEIFTSNSDEE